MPWNQTARMVALASFLFSLTCGCSDPAGPASGGDDRANWPQTQVDKTAAKAAAIKAAKKR